MKPLGPKTDGIQLCKKSNESEESRFRGREKGVPTPTPEVSYVFVS